MTDCRPPIAYCPEAEARAAIITEARSWLGTPYHHAADLKGIGVDCAMLLVRVYCDLELVEAFDPRPYTKDWMLHRSEEKFLGHLLARAAEIESPREGDVILFRAGRCYAHGAIVVRGEPLTIVHAYAPARVVVEDELARSPEIARLLPQAKFASYFAANPQGSSAESKS